MFLSAAFSEKVLDESIVQIINLGAGYDSLGLRMVNKYLSGDTDDATDQFKSLESLSIRMFEIDLPELIDTKCTTIVSDIFPQSISKISLTGTSTDMPVCSGSQKSHQSSNDKILIPLKEDMELDDESKIFRNFENEILGKCKVEDAEGVSPVLTKLADGMSVSVDSKTTHGIVLTLLGCDICDTNMLEMVLRENGFDPNKPTLILTECVLVYLQEIETMEIIKFFSSLCCDAAWISFDMVNPNDAFGRTMLQNINRSGPLLFTCDVIVVMLFLLIVIKF